MRVVLCNCPPADADRIARALVDERVAACVSATPAVSTYRWEGKVTTEPEVTLFIKVGSEALPRLRERLRALHPYQVPEIVVLSVDAAESYAPYVNWVREECR